MDFDFVNYSRRSLLLFVMVANIIGWVAINRRRPVCGLSGDRVGGGMNLETVNELIASLESAGELSIREQKFLKLAKEFKQLAAENVALKGGPQGFFAYGSECGYEEFDTAEEATEFAEAEIADFRDQACDGWSDEVGSVVWGIVMQRASMTGLRPVTEDDNVPSHIEEWCDYTLLPAVETPATDRIVAVIKAEAKSHDLNAFISHYSAELDNHIANGGDQFDERAVRLRGVIVGARMFREKLRDEEKALALREGADK